MPPVLNVTFDKLARCGAQQMFARDISFRHAERHHVLELVAETVCAAQLIERRTGPHAATERLVEQPAIEHEIHAGIGRRDLDRAEQVVPEPGDAAEHFVEICGSIALQQIARLVSIVRLPQKENDLNARAGLQFNCGLQRGTGIEAGAESFEKARRLVRAPPGVPPRRCVR